MTPGSCGCCRVGAESLDFDSRAGQMSRDVAAAAISRRSCGAHTLSRLDGSRHSLHASP